MRRGALHPTFLDFYHYILSVFVFYLFPVLSFVSILYLDLCIL